MSYQIAQNKCFICSKELSEKTAVPDRSEIFFICDSSRDNHIHFHSYNNKGLSRLKVKLPYNYYFLNLVVDYQNNTSEVWIDGKFDHRIIIKTTLVIDDLTPAKLCDKIKTILTFA
jgi:hypothetical protein